MAHIRRRRLRDGTARWQARTSTGSRKGRSELARDFERKGDAETWLRDQGALIEQKGVSGGRVSVAAFISRWLSFLERQGRLARVSASGGSSAVAGDGSWLTGTG